MRFWIYLVLLVLISGCLPSERKSDSTSFSLQDPKVRQIVNFQDERKTNEVLKFISNSNPGLRYLAVSSLASLQDSTSIDSLQKVLQDEEFASIREAAAYALGQTKSRDAVSSILSLFKEEPSRKVQSALLEAIGKCGTERELNNLSKVKTYSVSDTLLYAGLAKGIYRFALRGITSASGTKKMMDILQIPNFPRTPRLYAAAYLQRAGDIEVSSYESTLVNLFLNEEDPEVRMFLAHALGKTKGALARETLLKAIPVEEDYRVQINSIRSLKEFEYQEIRDLLLNTITDENGQVSLAAAQMLTAKGDATDVNTYVEMARDSTTDWEVRAELYKATLKNISFLRTIRKDFFTKEIRARYFDSKNSYERAALIYAMAEHGNNYPFLAQQAFNVKDKIVSSAAIQALGSLRTRPDIVNIFGQGTNWAKRELDIYLRRAALQKDISFVSTAASIFSDPDMGYEQSMTNINFLIQARDSLKLPRDYEAFAQVQKAINHLSDSNTDVGNAPDYNHPIDWKTISIVPDSSLATIRCGYGDIKIELYTKLAPGSVANFVSLAKSGFYNDKTFHRVVPNFVAQGGCPRGDGWGSLDHTIRSELGHAYYDQAGYIGMASAGKDTEGTQWFITHSPTPHLDGRYSIFGRVVEGMDVVHQLRVGDKIESIKFN